MKVWEGKQVIGFLLTWRLLRPQLQQQTTDKYCKSHLVTLIQFWQICQNDLFKENSIANFMYHGKTWRDNSKQVAFQTSTTYIYSQTYMMKTFFPTLDLCTVLSTWHDWRGFNFKLPGDTSKIRDPENVLHVNNDWHFMSKIHYFLNHDI